MQIRHLLAASGLLFFFGCADNPLESPDALSSSAPESSSSEEDKSSSSNGITPSSSSKEVDPISVLLIDDFEEGNTDNLKGGYWYAFSDNTDGGASKITPAEWEDAFVTTGGYNSNGMISLNVSLVKADYPYDPYFAIGTLVPKDTSSSPKDFAGISYWHKGVAHTFRIDIEEVEDYDNHLLEIPAHADWTLVTIDFNDLAQEGWGTTVALNLDQDIKVMWVLRKKSGDFAIDDVRYVKEIVYEKQNNMPIFPPETPTALVPNGDVNSALNTLSQKYLTKGLNFTNWGEQVKIDSNQAPSEWLFNEASVQKQADQGLLGLRLPIDLDLYIVERDSVLKGTKKDVQMEPFLFAVLDSFNVWTKRHGLSYTIDFHAYDGTFNSTSAKDSVYRRVVSTIWKRVAAHYVDETREDLFFELTNEPDLNTTDGKMIAQADWKSLAQMMIDSIRTVSPTRPIIFGDVDFYSLDKLVSSTPFDDAYVIYAFHMYDPFIFTHQGAAWSDMGTTKNVPFPYSEEKWSTEYRDFGIQASTPAWIKSAFKSYFKQGNKTYIKNRLIKAKNWAYDNQVPLICNEWGAYSKSAKIEDLNNYFQTMGEIFEELDISWQVWFGIMDDDYTLLPGMAEALGL